MNLVGSRLGPYEIIEEIGRGGMATVYRAYQPSVDRFVAVKIIHRAIASDGAALERFQREARLIARLEHPHLLPVYDYNGEHDPPYIVMRYLEGGTIKDTLETGALPLADVVLVVRQVSAALDYAHRQGVIHRDIKPSNVMIDVDGNAFLMDFGIARLMETSPGITQPGFAVGTPTYMSPEQGQGLATVDGRTDIYALGILIFQLLTGEVPFRDENPLAVILQHISQTPPAPSSLNPELPPEVDAVLAKVLAKKPDDRYQTATALANDLLRAAQVAPDAAPVNVKQSAERTYASILAARAAHQDEIDATMAGFEAARLGTTVPAPVRDGPTAFVTTAQPVPRQTRSWLWMVALLVLIVAGGLLLNQFGQGVTLPPTDIPFTMTPTQLALAATDVPTRTPRPTEPPSATVTLPRPTDTLPPTASLTPSNTPSPTASATQTASPTFTPSATATPATPIALVRRTLTLRAGPGTDYPAMINVDMDAILEIVGISDDGSWFQVALPDGTVAWLSASSAVVETAGNLAAVPIALAPTDTPTATASPSPSPTITPTVFATLTPSVTQFPTLTPTLTASPTDTLVPTLAAVSLPTATPPPPGSLPFIADFEADAPLAEWDYDPAVWQVVDDAGERVLIGQASLRQPLVVMGQTTPEWLRLETDGIVISTRFNIGEGAGGARILFRQSNVGYYALELFPGLMILRRSTGNPDFTNRDLELPLRSVDAPISTEQWHEMAIWGDGSRIYVYLDRQLYINAEDLNQPQLGVGAILLQTNSQTRPVRFDDFSIRRAETVSTHFQGAEPPTTWMLENDPRARLAQEAGGNQYLYLEGESAARPALRSLRDVNLMCRLNSFQGGFEIRLREDGAGGTQLAFDAGSLVISNLNELGAIIDQRRVQNIYNRARWENWEFSFVGDRLAIYRDGVLRFEEVFQSSPRAGGISFLAAVGNLFGIDDCLVTETVIASNVSARVFFDLRVATEARPFQVLRNDFDENFDDAFRTDDWWLAGQSAPGEFFTDVNSTNNRQVLRMSYEGRPTWRLFRGDIDASLFGNGADNARFGDSSDMQASALVRLPDAPGTAWLVARASTTLSGANIIGYSLELTRAADGELRVQARIIEANEQRIIYSGALPGGLGLREGDWVPLEIITYQNKVGFFVAGEFVGSVETATMLGGTVALGVEPGTTADFDTLIIRDVTPHS